MNAVTDGTTGEGEQQSPPPTTEIEFVETYETDEGVVFYNVDNPLAWLESSETLSLDNYR